GRRDEARRGGACPARRRRGCCPVGGRRDEARRGEPSAGRAWEQPQASYPVA
ncbi:hypothetical protein HMPREF9006_0358, partial [Actinomyces sp. oral taxon 180 str. F0310]